MRHRKGRTTYLAYLQIAGLITGGSVLIAVHCPPRYDICEGVSEILCASAFAPNSGHRGVTGEGEEIL